MPTRWSIPLENDRSGFLPVRLQADQFQQIIHALLLGRAGQPEQAAVKADDFAGGHVLVEVGRFGQIGDLLFDVNVAGGLAQHQHFAGGGEDQAQQGLDRGRLARAVRAEKAEDLAFVDVQADVVDGGDFFVLLDQVFDLDGFGIAGRGRPVARAGRLRGGGGECGVLCHGVTAFLLQRRC